MEKRKLASALGYTPPSPQGPGDPAPVLLASGRGLQADRMIAIAQEAGVAVVEDAALAALLDTSARPGDYIPPWCWEAAAKILAFVSELKVKDKHE